MDLYVTTTELSFGGGPIRTKMVLCKALGTELCDFTPISQRLTANAVSLGLLRRFPVTIFWCLFFGRPSPDLSNVTRGSEHLQWLYSNNYRMLSPEPRRCCPTLSTVEPPELKQMLFVPTSDGLALTFFMVARPATFLG